VWTTVAALAVAYALTGFPVVPGYTRLLDTGLFPDVLHERALAWEAIYGNPYRPFGEIVAAHGYPPPPVAGMNARTPGALLLQLPLLLIPERVLLLTTVGLVLIQLAFALFLTKRIVTASKMPLAAGPLFFVSFPAVTAIMFGATTVLLMVDFVLLAWAFRDRRWAGVPLGLAMASRLWPALIAVGFWIGGYRRTAVHSIGVCVVISTIGLFLPAVTLTGTVASVIGGTAAWVTRNQNVSAALTATRIGIPIVVPVVLI
jgi:hypothetical protein